ncbi:hypothetical protein AB0A73_21950 [Glycomyces sp. NPDC047369]
MTDHIVTDDPALLDALHAQDAAGADSRALGEYAVAHLHLEPPRRLPGGSIPAIVMQWYDGDFDAPGTPVWVLDMGEADPEDDFDDTGGAWPT